MSVLERHLTSPPGEPPMRATLRFLPLSLLLALALPVVAGAQAPIVVRALVGRTGRVLADTMGATFELPAAAGRSFAAMQAVLDDLKVPVEVRDSSVLQIGNAGFVKRGSFAGRRMSAWVDCGSNMSGPRADNYRIELGTVAFLTAAGRESSQVRIAVVGTALDVGEAARPTIPCYTTGALERRLHELLLKKLEG